MNEQPSFGRYEILGALGQRGFATGYRAWDPVLGRGFALRALLHQPELTEHFGREDMA